MKNKQLFALLLLLCPLFGWSQSVELNEEAPITRLVEKYVSINQSTDHVTGWRVQLVATTDRMKLEEALKQFKARYPDIFIDWVHNKPYYKLKAGAFTSKLDAIRLQYQLKSDYPSAYPVQDSEIKPSELVQ